MKTGKVKFYLLPENIVMIECEPHTVMELEDGKLSTAKVRELTGGQRFPMLCDLTNVEKITQECRQYFAGREHAEVFSKCALIITNPIAKIIGNFFLGPNKSTQPTRLFTNRDDGLAWLRKGEESGR